MPIYLSFKDKKIKGDVTTAGYKDWVQVDNFQFAYGRGVTMDTGNTQNRETGQPNLSEVTVDHKMGRASPGLFKSGLSNIDGQTIKVVVVRTNPEGPVEYVSFELSNCLITSYAFNAADGARPNEHLSISYTKIEMTYTHSDSANKPGSKEIAGYDLATCEVL